MTGKLRTPPQRRKRKFKLVTRLMLPMLLLVALQLATFFGILIIGGEFSFVEQYAYNNLIEKTENRKGYIENEMVQKMPFVQEYSERVNAIVSDILLEEKMTIADLQTERSLSNRILESSVEVLVELLRRSVVNDVYLILDTGDLYAEDGQHTNEKAALYLRDLDAMTDAGYEDLLMEVGLSSISQKYSIMLDSGWSLHYDLDPDDKVNAGFYYDTVSYAQEHRRLGIANLGYWTGFSRHSNNASASMKFTMPLTSADGTIYGVVGIGLTENSILTILPANDFANETACYLLVREDRDGEFSVVTHSGSAYYGQVGDKGYLRRGTSPAENVYEFTTAVMSEGLMGSVQYISLYSQWNPHRTERWALISLADSESLLSPLASLIRMLIIAAVVSVIVSALVVVLSSRMIARPMTKAAKTMSAARSFNQVIHFEPSHIEELDEMTDAITQLQINVQDFSSQVSQMIRIANVGLGTFMYDRADDTVFVGQSLLKLLQVTASSEEDIMMDRRDFLYGINAEETRQAIIEGLEFVPDSDEPEFTREYSITDEHGTTRWLRLNLIYNTNKSIGVLQDVTDSVMEKKRIEYERDYDSTTGLLNRHAYYHRLAELFQEPENLKVTAILMLDLDNLKYVNDTYGHDFGDDYIKTAANALKRFQPYGGVVSRLSGDEFNVCLAGFNSKEEIRDIIKEVREQLLQSSCLLADGTQFKVRASMGIAWYPDDAKSYELLMKYADFAMYTIKHSKKGGIAEFDMHIYSQDSVLLTGVEEMNRIIDERSVRYAFQSIVMVKTGEVYGYEALMRPQSHIFQTQIELMRTAKTGAKTYEIERLTWLKSLEDFQTQIKAGHIAEGSRIFVNSIANCALEPADMDAVEDRYQDLLHRIVLELVESDGANPEHVLRKTRRMQKWHAQVALDDFGINYNSEHALTMMKPNIIKIDRSIISGCDKDVSRRGIINSLVKLAHGKGIMVLAGGVETEDEMRAVIECGIDLLQGYYINRPLFEPDMPSQEVVEMMKKLAAQVRDE